MADTDSRRQQSCIGQETKPDADASQMCERTPTHLDLFSGIGGFAIAAQWAGFRTIAFCEIDKYCQKVLAKNFMADATGRNHKHSAIRKAEPESSCPIILSNIFDLDGRQFGGVDLITGGFPCQPFSVAGKRRGAADDRAIWPEMFRVISEARPAWVLGENVPGIIQMELDNVLSDLEGIGYATRSFIIPACAVDARHRRDRLWVVGRNVSDSESERLEGRNIGISESEWRFSDTWESSRSKFSEWLPEPDVGRVAHGIPNRVDRLKGLGNAIVPQVAYQILREIRKLIYE